MGTETIVQSYPSLSTILLSLLTVGITLANVVNLNLPILNNARASALVIGVIGLILCTIGGIGRAVQSFGWTHPATLLGIVLGIAAGLLMLTVIFDIHVPMLANHRTTVFLLAGIIVVKFAIHWIGSLLS